jgi:regulator of sigma E protease
LGGYVSFPDDDKNCELAEDSPERFINKPKWQRAIVVSAGVIANVVCALALVMFVAIWSKQLPSGNYEVFVSKILTTAETGVEKSGLQIGDKILAVNNSEINNVYSLVTLVKNSAKNNGVTTVETVEKNYDLLKGYNPGLERDELIPAELPIRLPDSYSEDIYSLDKYAAKGAKYFKKDENGPIITLTSEQKALRDTIQNNNSYVLISDGKYSLYDVAIAVSDGVHPINIKVLRNGEEISLNPVYPNSSGAIGISMETKQTMISTNTIPSVIKNSNKYLLDNTYLMIYSLGQLFTGNVPLKDMHGVVAITKIGGDMIEKSGATSGILLAALISMNLAILNILPIPALDGGHLMFLIIEKLLGKPLDDNIIEKISTVFFALLIILMVLIVFNDISLLIKK